MLPARKQGTMISNNILDSHRNQLVTVGLPHQPGRTVILILLHAK